jgi:coatomer protein complex subunit gamma
MQPLEGSDVAINNTTHNLKMFGKTVSGGRVVANIRMAYSTKQGVALKATVRAEEEGVAAMVVGGIA